MRLVKRGLLLRLDLERLLDFPRLSVRRDDAHARGVTRYARTPPARSRMLLIVGDALRLLLLEGEPDLGRFGVRRNATGAGTGLLTIAAPCERRCCKEEAGCNVDVP